MNLNEITQGPLTSPADLIDLSESLFPPPPLAPTTMRWAFRGQSQPFGTLVPSFQRIFVAKRSVGAAEIIEQDLIRTFREHYARLEDRTKDMPPTDLIREGYTLRCLSVMQHYGVPTRLLDWSSDFWTAVYFACAGDPAKEAELWMYDRNIFTPQQSARYDLQLLVMPVNQIYSNPPPEQELLRLRGENLIVELDPKISPRMKKQFAHHTVSSAVFADHAPLLFDMAKDFPGSFQRVLIAPTCKEKALRYLEEQLEVTAGSIFPDVEGLGKFLHWHLESLVTTLL